MNMILGSHFKFSIWISHSREGGRAGPVSVCPGLPWLVRHAFLFHYHSIIPTNLNCPPMHILLCSSRTETVKSLVRNYKFPFPPTSPWWFLINGILILFVTDDTHSPLTHSLTSFLVIFLTPTPFFSVESSEVSVFFIKLIRGISVNLS